MRIVFGNFLTLVAGEFISKLGGFLTTVYLARTFGVADFGTLGFALAIFSYFGLLANPGLDGVGIRQAAKGGMPLRLLGNAIFTLRLAFSLLSLLLLLLATGILDLDELTTHLLLLQGLNLLLAPFQVQFIFRGLDRMELVALTQILQSLAYLVFVVLLVQTEAQLLYVPLLFFLSSLLGLVPLIGVYHSRVGNLALERNSGTLKSILLAAMPLGLSSFMIQIYYNLDFVFIGFLMGPVAVGLYSAAYKIIHVLVVFPGIIFSSFFPSLARAREEGGERGEEETLSRYILVMMLIGIPVGFGGYFAAPGMIQVLYGSQYAEAVVPLRVLLFNVACVFISMAFANPLIARGRNREYLFVVATGAGVNSVLNLFLIPPYGLPGAALATVFSEIAVAIQARRQLDKIAHLRLKTFGLVPLFSAAAAFVICFVLSGSIDEVGEVWLLPAFILTYLVLISFWRGRFVQLLSPPMNAAMFRAPE